MRNIRKKIDRIDFRKFVWILAISETIHNIEEAVWLPASAQVKGFIQPSVSSFQFRFADLIVTLVFYWIFYYFYKHNNKFAICSMCGVLVVILFNVFIPHLAATVILGRYAPGVVSGVILNIPVSLYMLRRGLKEGTFNHKILIMGSLGVVIVVLPILAASFSIGKIIEKIFL